MPVLITDSVASAKAAGLPRNNVLAAVVRLLETTLLRVGNTPEVIASYLDKTLLQNLARQIEQATQEEPHGLNADEKAVMALLQQRLAATQAVA